MTAPTKEEIAVLIKVADSNCADPYELIGKMADALEALSAEREWKPIATAPRDLVEGADDPIEIACFRNGALIWSCAAYWGTATYGDIHCASRSGWYVLYFPPTAKHAGKPKPSGDWLMPDAEMEPTHWRKFPSPPQEDKEEAAS